MFPGNPQGGVAELRWVFRQLEVLLEATQVAASQTPTERTLHSDHKDLDFLQSHGKSHTCQAYVSQDHSLSKSTHRASVLDGLTLGKPPLMLLALNLFRSQAEEVALGLRALPEVLSSIPHNNMVAHNRL